MNRRDFFKRLGGAAAAVALSPLLDLAEVAAPPSLPAMRLVVSDSPEFAFGFTGFVPAGMDVITGQIRYMCNMELRSDSRPRLQRMIYGITS